MWASAPTISSVYRKSPRVDGRTLFASALNVNVTINFCRERRLGVPCYPFISHIPVIPVLRQTSEGETSVSGKEKNWNKSRHFPPAYVSPSRSPFLSYPLSPTFATSSPPFGGWRCFCKARGDKLPVCGVLDAELGCRGYAPCRESEGRALSGVKGQSPLQGLGQRPSWTRALVLRYKKYQRLNIMLFITDSSISWRPLVREAVTSPFSSAYFSSSAKPTLPSMMSLPMPESHEA